MLQSPARHIPAGGRLRYGPRHGHPSYTHDRHAPLLGRGLHQHDAGRSAGLAASRQKSCGWNANRRCSGRRIGIADRLIDLHALPVRIQFVRDNQRQRRANYGAHLRAMSNDAHRAVRLDTHKHIGMKCGLIASVRASAGSCPHKIAGAQHAPKTSAPAPAMPLRNQRRLTFSIALMQAPARQP